MLRSELISVEPARVISKTGGDVVISIPSVDSDGKTVVHTGTGECLLEQDTSVDTLIQRREVAPRLSYIVLALISPKCRLCSSLNRCNVGLDPATLKLSVS
ncbi:MAG: hypothetical protein V1922_01445 [bacterium]